MPMANVAGRGMPTARRRDKSIGGVIGSRGRGEASGVNFNYFPAIGDELPDMLSDIVQDTVDDLDRTAAEKAPVGETGKLEAERKITFSTSRGGGGYISGRIGWNARDPYGGHKDHEYPFYVEVGTVDTAAQPFVVPALMEVRPRFNARLKALENMARDRLGIPR